jgi:hypothetical protein
MLDPLTSSVPDLFRHGPNKKVAPFSHMDVANITPSLAAAIPSQTESFLLLALPVSVPILHGADSTVRGPITEGHVDSFESNLEGSSWWLTTSYSGQPPFKWPFLPTRDP